MSQEPKQLLEKVTSRLVRDGAITSDQLAVAEVTCKTLGGDLGHILIKKGFVTEDTVRGVMLEELALEQVSLADFPIDPSVVKAVPYSVAKKYNFMPLYRVEDLMTVAISDPLALFGLIEMGGMVSCQIKPVLAPLEEIEEAVRMHYQQHSEGSFREGSIQIVQKMDDEAKTAESEDLKKLASGSRIVAAINTVIGRAVRERASDIHIEPQEDGVKIRYRLDGLLEERMVFPKGLQLPIISRIKVLSGMDIAERRIPQDGRVRVKMKGAIVDLRISTYPTMHGEKIVIRLLMKEGILSLEQLGLQGDDKQRFAELIERPHGIFLVTGPTGSGKTSTLYTALARVNSQECNIVSVEDPVENEVVGVNQAQVNVKAGMTFAAALRSILRQDPDIIMVGEIRDRETADMAVRAALTGHLVFSTLHTNSAAGVIERMIDMGIERFLLSSALIGAMGQRLVRRICSECKTEKPVDANLKTVMKDIGYDGPVFYGKGCETCRMSGYRGRVGIFELLIVDDEIRRLITEGATEESVRRYMREHKIRDMRGDGLDKIRQGVTTLDELVRVTQDV